MFGFLHASKSNIRSVLSYTAVTSELQEACTLEKHFCKSLRLEVGKATNDTVRVVKCTCGTQMGLLWAHWVVCGPWLNKVSRICCWTWAALELVFLKHIISTSGTCLALGVVFQGPLNTLSVLKYVQTFSITTHPHATEVVTSICLWKTFILYT